MTKYKNLSKRDWIRIIVYITGFVGVITIGAIFLYCPPYFFIWLILVMGSLLLFMRWHVKNFAYR